MSFNRKSTNVFKWASHADVVTISDGGVSVNVCGTDMTDWIRDQITTNFCPRCGNFLRNQRMPLDFQCIGCDAEDEK